MGKLNEFGGLPIRAEDERRVSDGLLRGVVSTAIETMEMHGPARWSEALISQAAPLAVRGAARRIGVLEEQLAEVQQQLAEQRERLAEWVKACGGVFELDGVKYTLDDAGEVIAERAERAGRR